MKNNKEFNTQPSKEKMREIENLYKSNELAILEKKLRELIKIHPKASTLFNILGITLQKKGFFTDAIAAFKKAIEIQPGFDHALNNVGNVLKNIGKFDEAVTYYKNAIKVNSRYAEAYTGLGNVLKEIGNFDDSISNHLKAIKINPNFAEAYSNLGNTLFELAKFEEAAENHNKAIKINPNYAEAYSNLGNALGELGKFEEAIENYRQAMSINPKYKDPILNLSLIGLAQGKFETAWKGYEFRFYKTNRNLIRYEPEKIWDGNYLDGTLLVWGEQGIGDHILFGSMLSDLKKCAKKIIVEIDKRLINLFKNYFKKINFSNIEVIGIEEKNLRIFDKHIAIGSIAQYLRNNKETFKNTPIKYLIPSAQKEKELKNKYFLGNNIKIGISWKTLNKKQQFRNIDIEKMLPIFKKPNCDFINLQFGETKDDLEKLKSKHGIEVQNIGEIDNFRDVENLAALINNLDLIITIQNSTAHLSAALGKETWIMLTKNSRWHWTINEKKSLWYPKAKLFQQDQLGDWNKVINDVSMSLKKI